MFINRKARHLAQSLYGLLSIYINWVSSGSCTYKIKYNIFSYWRAASTQTRWQYNLKD